MSTTALLETRGTTHGDFADNARNGQFLRDFYRSNPNWERMHPIHREALDMIACKLSRILSGQSTHDDHWKDLAGYATLALDACAHPVEGKPGVFRANRSGSIFSADVSGNAITGP